MRFRTDPYYFLQYDLPEFDTSDANFVHDYCRAFTPSFLSMDVDGRVIRIDSFSKILAPGMRLGWITASPAFTERLVVLTDSSTMHPHGFGQTFVLELLGPRGWGIDGFVRWVHSLCADYRKRRDNFLRVFHSIVPSEYATTYEPQAGMFFWISVALDKHPRYTVQEELNATTLGRTNEAALMDELFHKLLKDGLVMMPASIFAIVEKNKPIPDSQRLNCFRATFAGTEAVVQQGLSVFAKSVQEFFAC
jgi:aromatic amino acid aminotransferase I